MTDSSGLWLTVLFPTHQWTVTMAARPPRAAGGWKSPLHAAHALQMAHGSERPWCSPAELPPEAQEEDSGTGPTLHGPCVQSHPLDSLSPG